MPASRVSVINTARFRLGLSTRITSASEDPAADDLIDNVRDWVLRQHPWNSCKKRRELVALSAAPEFGYTYQYPLPDDYIRMVYVYEQDKAFWEIEETDDGNVLLTDSATAKIVYVHRQDDYSRMPADLVEAISAKLALQLAATKSGMTNREASMEKWYMRSIATAKAMDSQDSAAMREYNQRITDAHRYGVANNDPTKWREGN